MCLSKSHPFPSVPQLNFILVKERPDSDSFVVGKGHQVVAFSVEHEFVEMRVHPREEGSVFHLGNCLTDLTPVVETCH